MFIFQRFLHPKPLCGVRLQSAVCSASLKICQLQCKRHTVLLGLQLRGSTAAATAQEINAEGFALHHVIMEDKYFTYQPYNLLTYASAFRGICFNRQLTEEHNYTINHL